MYLDLNIPWPVDCFADIASGAKRSGTGKHNKRALGASRAISAVSVVNNGETHDGLSELQRKQVKNILEDLTHFGFTSIAFNHIVQTRYRGETNHFGLSGGCVVQPPDAISLPVFPHLASTGPRLRKPRAKFGAGLAPQLQQLQRLTVTMDDSSLTKGGHGFTSSQAAALATWDLIAVQPTTDSAFSLACQTLTELKPFSVDIISLELASSSRLPFAPKRSTLRTAIRSGAVFEITYSAMLAGASEESEKERERKKRNLVSNTRDLLRLTGGKGIIISSGAATLLDIRGPKDVIAVASIFGMSPQAAKDSISATARAVLTRAQARRSFRGVMEAPVLSAGCSIAVRASSPSAQTTGTLPHSSKPSDGDPNPMTDMEIGFSMPREQTTSIAKRKHSLTSSESKHAGPGELQSKHQRVSSKGLHPQRSARPPSTKLTKVETKRRKITVQPTEYDPSRCGGGGTKTEDT